MNDRAANLAELGVVLAHALDGPIFRNKEVGVIDNGAYKSNAKRYRSTTRTDTIAFNKRVAKRRAKKGYK